MAEPITVDNGALTDYAVLVDDVIDATLGTGAKQLVGLADATIGSTTKVAAGGGVEANALRVTIASDSTGVVSVDDNGSTLSIDDGGGSLTVDGSVAVSGAVDTELTTADLDTGVGTDTRAVVGLVKAASGGGVLVSDANPLPVSDAGGTLSVDDGAGSLTVDGSVSLAAAIPAGTNNIGDVDVLSVPAPLSTTGAGTEATALRVTLASDSTGLVSVDDNGGSLTVDGTVGITGAIPAGTNNIGDVDVLTVPAPLSTTGGGTEAAALRVTLANDSTGVVSVDDNGGSLTVDGAVSISAALPAGTNNIGDVDVLSVVPGTGATNLGKAESAAHTSADVGVMVLGVRNDAGTALAVDGAYIPLSLDSAGAVRVTGGGGGTQYTEGDIDATVTGTAMLWEDAADTLRAVSAAKPLPISDAGGSVTVDGSVSLAAAIPAGTNNIGDVDVVSSALPTGASTLAEQQSQTTALQLLDDIVKTDDAAFTPATDEVAMAGFFADETSTDSVDEGDAGAARMTLDRRQITVPQGHAAGGLDIFRSLDLDESEEDVKTTAGTLYGWYIANLATTTRFVKFYNATAATVVVGTTTPVLTLPIPGNSTDDIAANALGGVGIKFDTAICVAATTGVADADTGAPAANDVVINLFYK